MLTCRTILAAAIFLFADSAHAGSSPTPPSCKYFSPIEGRPAVTVPTFTQYQPQLGGINGSCNGGASKHLGFSACKHTLDDYIEGKSSFIHVAAQQNNGSAQLFGCWAHTNGFPLRKISTPNACDVFAVADRYAPRECQGCVGSNGRVQGIKVDVELRARSKYANWVASGDKNATKIQCVARLVGVLNREKSWGGFQVQRAPQAIVPVRTR